MGSINFGGLIRWLAIYITFNLKSGLRHSLTSHIAFVGSQQRLIKNFCKKKKEEVTAQHFFIANFFIFCFFYICYLVFNFIVFIRQKHIFAALKKICFLKIFYVTIQVYMCFFFRIIEIERQQCCPYSKPLVEYWM